MESQELYTAECSKCLIKKEEYTIKPRPYDLHLCIKCHLIQTLNTDNQNIIDIVKTMYD